jgi:hypothetical protein
MDSIPKGQSGEGEPNKDLVFLNNLTTKSLHFMKSKLFNRIINFLIINGSIALHINI